MSKQARKVPQISSVSTSDSGLVVGTLVKIADGGVPIVTAPMFAAPVAARTVVQLARASCEPDLLAGSRVLLSVEDSASAAPIIVGLIGDTIWLDDQLADKVSLLENGKIDARIDGKNVHLVARDEIVLKCGQSKIILRKDGSIIVKGVTIITRAARTNKIKGGSVSIN